MATTAPSPTPATPAAAPASPATPAAKVAATPPTPSEVRKLKLKLEGQDVEMPESEVIALAQQGKVSGKRFQEAAAMQKQAQDVIKFAKENPTEFFKKTGMNARQWAEEYLMGELKREAMSPEQKRAADNESKLREYEAERKQAADKKLADETAAEQAKYVENYNALFVEALGKSGLPKTPYTVKRMAELQLTNIKKKLELSPDQLAKLVREDYIAEQKALFGSSEGEQLLEILGPELVKKLSKAQISRLKAKGVTSAASAPARKSNEAAPLSWREYQLRNRGRLK